MAVSYLYEALADVTGAEGFVAAGGQRQSREEEEESGGGGSGEDQLTKPHPDGSPARHWEHLRQHRDTGQDRGEQARGGAKTNKQKLISEIPQDKERAATWCQI